MTTLQTPIEMQRPAIVRFGAGQVETLAAWLEASGVTRPFVVADKVNAARLRILGLGEPALFGDVKPEPDLPNLEAAVAAARAAGADAVVGFGGGSAMDLAKLVAVLVASDLRLPDISGPNRAPARRVGARADPDDRRDRQRGRDAGADHRPRDDEQGRDGER